MKKDVAYLRRLKEAVLQGNPSSIGETIEEVREPGAGVVQVYRLGDGTEIHFPSAVDQHYKLPDGQIITFPADK